MEELQRTTRPTGGSATWRASSPATSTATASPTPPRRPESDLGRPQGGAVFIYKGTAAGLPATATWTLVGESDTAALGTVMAAET